MFISCYYTIEGIEQDTKKSFAVLIYDSLQDAPCHMKRATYGCFLSDLTGFMGFHCTGPGDCHKSVLQSHKSYYTALQEKCNTGKIRGKCYESDILEQFIIDSAFERKTGMLNQFINCNGYIIESFTM